MTAEEKSPSLLLDGYRALDLTDIRGFFCGRLLGDLGVDVIKIEKPGGDPARRLGSFYHDRLEAGTGFYWWVYNANKRGITLDWETVDGREILKRLVRTADFVIESFAPGYLQGIGLDHESISKLNPRVITTSITPFGQSGPRAKEAACDLTCWASGGQMFSCGDPDRPPMQLHLPHAFLHAGSEAAVGTLVAHYHRELTGAGQQVDVSAQESVIQTLMGAVPNWAYRKVNAARVTCGWTFSRPDGHPIQQHWGFECKDGRVVCYTQGGTLMRGVKHLQALVKWMDEEGAAPDLLKKMDWIQDYQTANLTEAKVAAVEAAVGAFLRTKTKQELSEQGLKRDLLIFPIADPKDIWESRQLRDQGFWQEVAHPELDATLAYCGLWAKMNGQRLQIRRRAPLPGEHNDEIYIGELGMTRNELLSLHEAGVV